jgi:hypothetical protein
MMDLLLLQTTMMMCLIIIKIFKQKLKNKELTTIYISFKFKTTCYKVFINNI